MEAIEEIVDEDSMLASIEVAAILGIKVRTVRLYARTGVLKATQVKDPSRRASGGGIQYLFRLGDILNYMAKRDERAARPPMTNAQRAARYHARKKEKAAALRIEGT